MARGMLEEHLDWQIVQKLTHFSDEELAELSPVSAQSSPSSYIATVTPAQRHQGQDKALLKKRDKVYQMAYQAHPERWSRSTRNWSWINQVQLNPDRDLSRKITNSRVAA